jgi:hypothetical protein
MGGAINAAITNVTIYFISISFGLMHTTTGACEKEDDARYSLLMVKLRQLQMFSIITREQVFSKHCSR